MSKAQSDAGSNASIVSSESGAQDQKKFDCGQAVTNVKDASVAYWRNSYNYYREKPVHVKTELLSGLTLAIMQVPESIAFSFVAGVRPSVGLWSSIILGFITAAFGGRPGMLSGVSGAMVTVMAGIMDQDGSLPELSPEQRFEVLHTTLVFAGILEIIIGIFKWSKFLKLVPHAAFIGFFNGLAIVIFISQLRAFTEPEAGQDPTNPDTDRNYITDGGQLAVMLFYIFFTLVVMRYVPRLTNIVPASLISLVGCTAFEYALMRPAFGVETRTIADEASLTAKFPSFVDLELDWSWDTYKTVITTGITLAVVRAVSASPPRASIHPAQHCIQLSVAPNENN